MPDFEARLNQARNGNGLLFCGAGFTADCLSFSPSAAVGTGSHLLSILNHELQRHSQTPVYQRIQTAADAYKERFGEIALMELLKTRFTLQNISADIVDVLRFPWERVYTTNYDDGVEQALRKVARQHRSFNNLDSPDDLTDNLLPVIHLHGFVEKWNSSNFGSSCVLGAESYHRLDTISRWLREFRFDVERAELVVFVGFSADDFHLNDILFNISGVREKIFFVNRSTAEPDPDMQMTQKRFGKPIYIGRSGFAATIVRALQSEAPKEPKLSSFQRYVSAAPEDDLPSVTDIEDLFLFGKINARQIARDAALDQSDYHVHRPLIKGILSDLEQQVHIALVVGEICDGKTLILENLRSRLSVNRQVFCLRHPYEELLDEVSRILLAYPRAVLVVENCFDLREDRLATLARMFDASDGLLLLSSRNISAEAETAQVQRLGQFGSFRQYSTGPLADDEVDALIVLMDQIAAWNHIQANWTVNKKRFIVGKCRGSFPNFLLELLESPHVLDRYKEEYLKVAQLSRTQQAAIIVALYISSIGHNTPLGFLSDAFQTDAGGMLDRLNENHAALRLLRQRGGYVETVPSIGARNILKLIIADRDIVDSVISVLRYLSEEGRYGDFERHIFGQMMRYSILRSVVTDREQIDRFFDNISKHRRLRRRILFWLQWHMAKTDMREFDKAEKYLDEGYAQAKQYERDTGRMYNRKQLDDRKAKFLMLRSQHVNRQPVNLYRDMEESCQIVDRLLREDGLTRYPFETLKIISDTFASKHRDLLEVHHDPIRRRISKLAARANTILSKVPQGYQQHRAEVALRDVIRSMTENVTPD